MQKDELRKLRALPATKEMLEKGKCFEEIQKKRWDGSEYIMIQPEFDLLVRVQNLSGYIKIALFLPEKMRKNIRTPKYEIFLNTAGGEYITRELDGQGKEVRWLSAMIRNLRGVHIWEYGNRRSVYLSRDGENTLNRLELKKVGNQPLKGVLRLNAWQQEIKDKDTKQKEKKEQAPWDKDMRLIPKMPTRFEEWMRRDAVTNCYMIYEYDRKGQKKGFCSRCKRYVPIANPKHNKMTRCPVCKAESKFKSHKKMQALSTEPYKAEIMQKFNGGIVVRTFEQMQWYRDRKYTDPGIHTKEYKRVMIFDDGTVKQYMWGSYKNKYDRWILDKNYIPAKRSYYWIEKNKLYTRNITALKKHNILKRSAIDLWPELPVPVIDYLSLEKKNLEIEMLARMGMFRLAKDIIKGLYGVLDLDKSATEISKILKIDKSRLKRLKAMNANIYMLKWMQYEKLADTIWPDDMIRDFGEAEFETSVFGFLQPRPSFIKCHNYLKKQAGIMDETLGQTLITWRDYINMAESMKMDTGCDQIARPKDLKFAHNELILLKETHGLEKQAKELEKKWPKVNGKLPKLKKFEFTLGEYMILAPESVLDIVKEGTILKHCVHTCDYYFSRIQTDESYLFFLRHTKQPDMPWYTLEVEPQGNIRQKRTTGDRQNEDFKSAVAFLKKWQQYFKKQLTDEERELGEKANKLRVENYASLRKNGNRVWHGKLAGQLLADVLEADFMEVI